MSLKLKVGERVIVQTDKLHDDNKWNEPVVGTVELIKDEKNKALIRFDLYFELRMGYSFGWYFFEEISHFNSDSNVQSNYSIYNYIGFNSNIQPIHLKDNEYIMILAGDTYHVYKYNTNDNKYNILINIDNHLNKSPIIAHTFDQENNKYFVLCKNGKIASYDLIDKYWHIIDDINDALPIDIITFEKTEMIFINNKIHFILDTKHIIYDNKEKKLINCCTNIGNRNKSFDSMKLYYISSLNKLILCELNGNYNIYWMDINESNEGKCKWTMAYPVKKKNIIPTIKKVHCAHIFLLYEHILCILVLSYTNEYNIYFLDLMNGKYYLSNKIIKTNASTVHGYIIQRNNMLHFIGQYDHYKWSLSPAEMIPIQLRRYCQKNRTNPLIFGYIKKEEEKSKINVPILILTLLLLICY